MSFILILSFVRFFVVLLMFFRFFFLTWFILTNFFRYFLSADALIFVKFMKIENDIEKICLKSNQNQIGNQKLLNNFCVTNAFVLKSFEANFQI